MSEDDLLRMSTMLRWPLARGRVKALLPEVQRLKHAAVRLGELPFDPAMPPQDPPSLCTAASFRSPTSAQKSASALHPGAVSNRTAPREPS